METAVGDTENGAAPRPDLCRKGHDDWRPNDSSGRRYCYVCKKDHKRSLSQSLKNKKSVQDQYAVRKLCAALPDLETVLRAHPDQRRVTTIARTFIDKRVQRLLLRPSEFFPGIDPQLDARLIREHRNSEVDLLKTLAQVSNHEQHEFLELYLKDPDDARHWVSLPAWKRPMRKGDAEDRVLWDFFTAWRLSMESPAHGHNDQSWGRFMQQTGGKLAYVKNPTRWMLVLVGYGAVLAAGSRPEDRGTPPFGPARGSHH